MWAEGKPSASPQLLRTGNRYIVERLGYLIHSLNQHPRTEDMKITQPMLEPVILALPSFDNLKVAEISVSVANALGFPSVEACGSYKSGKLVLPSQVTNTLNGLAPTGAVVKVGHGRWTKPTNGGNAQEVVKMTVVEPQEVEVDLMEMIEEQVEVEVEEVEEVEVDPSEMLYDLSDSMTLDFFISQTSCYSKYVKSDRACGTCLLASHCAKAKALAKAERKEAKQAEAVKEQAKEQAGVKVDVPADAQLSSARSLTSKGKVVCVATGKEIAEGEPMWFVPKWGCLSNEAYQAVAS